ncbi:HNH endonuclease [Natroniella acetigena]|uniref:HNH endonuclease n=1 Tax=Natroniella acetigena TaxID=52004 RepID=UPI002009F7C6|nr:HNH endonuclease signature motif containing protein [Natroniella acetigena]MCK8827749.1 HNH endonuclease [Natroniella acetigena]
MSEIRKKDERVWRKLRGEVYEKCQDKDGYYICAQTGYKSKSTLRFDVDHIIPMSKGGKSRIDNLQLLRRDVNRKLGDKS